MATEASQPLKDTRVAGADLSALQYHFVKLNAAGNVVPITAVTDTPYGVLQNDPLADQECELVLIGITKVSADEARVPGDLVGVSADGQAQAVTGGETTVKILGQVRVAAGAAGRIGTAVINCVNPTVA
jgi:hypothetical protein